MSEKLCALRKIGGGTLKETTLWTNSAPTSNFASQTITLSDGISNYKFLKIRYRKNTTENVEHQVLYDVDDVISQFTSNAGAHYMGSIVERENSTPSYRTAARLYAMSNDTTMTISNAIYIDNPSTAQNAWAIPLEIIGVK